MRNDSTNQLNFNKAERQGRPEMSGKKAKQLRKIRGQAHEHFKAVFPPAPKKLTASEEKKARMAAAMFGISLGMVMEDRR